MRSNLARASNDDIPVVVSTKRISQQLLKRIDPLTNSQIMTFSYYKDEKNLALMGSAGTGKTFIALYLAMKEVLSRESVYNKVMVVRSCVPVRDIGFMPGSKQEKEEIYELPYQAIFKEIFHPIPGNGLMEKLREQKLYEFISTSYIRGITLHDTIVIVDEFESMTFHELDSIITRMGNNCKIIFCGDFKQTDLQKFGDKEGAFKFINILRNMYDFKLVEFTRDDIVRSDLVKSYIIEKEKLDL